MRKARYRRPLSIALSDETFGKIKVASDQLEISMADWIRQVIDGALSKADAEFMAEKKEKLSGKKTSKEAKQEELK
jgi:hypothetical protein